MMRFWLPVFVAGLISALSAQEQQKQPAPKPMTIIGCVAESRGVYRLDHAVASVDTDVDTQQRPSTEASPTPKMLSYMLTGADVKAHLGHKVEVTGTVSNDKTSEKAAEMKTVPGAKLLGTLNATSVKMVSASCP